MDLRAWAAELAWEHLGEHLPQRWRHVQGVARTAARMTHLLPEEREVLQAAALVHDVGYAPHLAVTGFHPLDGARMLRAAGVPERVAALVAHHSCAVVEAQLRGLASELQEFADEGGPVRDALWFCDLTTSPYGKPVGVHDRLAEIVHRYGEHHLVTRFIGLARPELLGAVIRTERRLAAAVQPT